MTMTYDTPILMGVVDYAGLVGASERTVKRWLADDELPGAIKDERGRWMIPSDAVRVPKVADVVAMPARPMTPSHDVMASHPSQARALNYDAMPSFLTIDQAAQLLGISRHAITTPRGRDYFDVVPFGPNGSLVVPLATIKKIRG